jgi:hypothetical protein
VASNCFGVKPLREACVATGMNMGRLTGPWGRTRTAARARVVCYSKDERQEICSRSRSRRARRNAVPFIIMEEADSCTDGTFRDEREFQRRRRGSRRYRRHSGICCFFGIHRVWKGLCLEDLLFLRCYGSSSDCAE